MRNRTRLMSTAAVAACAALTLGAAPVRAEQAPDRQVPTFEEYEKATMRDGRGQYLVNGDIPVATRDDLRAFYDRVTSPSLIVNQVYGQDDLWSASQARRLTYCVSDRFGYDKQLIVNAMSRGTRMWESATGGIDFTYVPSQDSTCTVRNPNVAFSVEKVTGAGYIARAFFPSSPKSQRNILVDVDRLRNAGGWSPGNVLGHELGHVLGFRHEHTRPEAGTCHEDDSWRPLTRYDSASIMHYPQCNGSSRDLSMTSTDVRGVRSVY